MGDFIQNSQTKNAVRILVNPIADIAAFNQIVQSVIADNPFGCVAYMTAGTSFPPVEKTRESYTVKIVYEDSNAKNIGNDSAKYNTVAGFNAGATALLASAANIAAHGGTAVRDSEHETFTATLRCHDANGELYFINFSRTQVTLTSYSDDAIRTTVETWADTVPALA
ncbi:MAG: hypothetical protein WAK10_00960 [Methanoregula sp.]